MGIVYKAKCLINGKSYVGKTILSLNERIRGHIKHSKKTTSRGLFPRSLIKYGFDNFEWTILCECDTPEILNIMETFYIIVYKTHINEGGYNITWGGDGGDTFTNSKKKEETREKNRIRNIGRRFSWGDDTQAGRDRLRECRMGKKQSKETIEKRSQSMKGKNTKPKTSEHRKHISSSLIGRKLSNEHIENIRKASTGRKHTNEAKKKMCMMAKEREKNKKEQKEKMYGCN